MVAEYYCRAGGRKRDSGPPLPSRNLPPARASLVRDGDSPTVRPEVRAIVNAGGVVLSLLDEVHRTVRRRPAQRTWRGALTFGPWGVVGAKKPCTTIPTPTDIELMSC